MNINLWGQWLSICWRDGSSYRLTYGNKIKWKKTERSLGQITVVVSLRCTHIHLSANEPYGSTQLEWKSKAKSDIAIRGHNCAFTENSTNLDSLNDEHFKLRVYFMNNEEALQNKTVDKQRKWYSELLQNSPHTGKDIANPESLNLQKTIQHSKLLPEGKSSCIQGLVPRWKIYIKSRWKPSAKEWKQTWDR